MWKRRMAAVHRAPLRQLEVTPRGKNGGLGKGSGRGTVLGGDTFSCKKVFGLLWRPFATLLVPSSVWMRPPRLVHFQARPGRRPSPGLPGR